MGFNIEDECCSQAYNAGYMLGSADKEVIIIKRLEQETDIIYEFAYAIELIKEESQKDNETVVLLTEGDK